MRPWIFAALAATGCTSADVVVGNLQEVTTFPATPNRDLDVLFVVDNSMSMADKQTALADNFPRMMDVLGQLDTGLPNLHIGVITSDMGTLGSDSAVPGSPVGETCHDSGDDGALQHASLHVTDAFISDVADPVTGDRITNYTGELRDVFAENALVGSLGCGFEQHLASMRRSFANPVNAGFLRPEANLAVVVLADEDDCSALNAGLFATDAPALGPLHSFRCFEYGVVCSPDDPRTPGEKTDCVPRADSVLVEDVQPFVDALLAQKADPRMIMVAGVVGPPDTVAVGIDPVNGGITALQHSCEFSGPTAPWVADPAVRLSAFFDGFPGRSTNTTICDDDFSDSLTQIGQTAKRLVGDPCFSTDGLADTSEAPGIQPACEVTDVRDAAPDAPDALPLCTTGAADCYEIVADWEACPATPDHLRVRFHRASATAPDTWTHVRCQKAQ